MPPQTGGDHRKLLTEVIQKQIEILGPMIALAKARSVGGITIADDGTVTQITGDHRVVTQELIEQFMQLSGLIVKKTLEPILANYPQVDVSAQAPQPTPPPSQSNQTEPLPTQPENTGMNNPGV